METKLTIQERLKDLRVVDRGLSLEQLAEQTGLSKSALGKYEAEDFKDIILFLERKSIKKNFIFALQTLAIPHTVS